MIRYTIRFFIPMTSDTIDLISTIMTKNSPGEVDTLVPLSVCVQITHIQYCLIPPYAERRHGSPSCGNLGLLLLKILKNTACTELRADSRLSHFPHHSSHFSPFPPFPHLQPCYLPSRPRYSPCFHGSFWHLLC